MTVDHIGRYRVTRMLGQGGMGVVYAAHDDRLDRPVAIKVVRADRLDDAEARERFRREARAAARVSHPNICMLYEFDEDNGQPFLVMELLEGEPLAARLQRGALPPAEATALGATMLDALAALHGRGVLHRDLKPANVFLTPHGLKLLDFGLAQPTLNDDITRDVKLTLPGMLIGTPQYMAPEQLLGRPADERSDVFAAAAVIYEMYAGQPAFGGRSLPELVHAVTYAEPLPLPVFPASAAIDRTLRRAFVKDPGGRLARAEEFATSIRQAALETESVPAVAPERRVTRFVALPLRVLRPDPETDFLAFSVPDAVSSALAAIESVIVRSPPAHMPANTDVRAIGRDLAVDVVLSGTILRSGNSVRVSAQLVDATAGTLIWSDTAQAPIDDLFQLQDAITGRIVSSLSLPLTARDRRALERQAPANAEAYELFMRANQLMTDSRQWDAARGLYERAVELDPQYAPAWAGLGRARRVMAKWGGVPGIGLLPQAEAAFRRALEINPDLSSAYDLAAYVDAELGRAPEAIERLLRRAAARPNDAGTFAGLVTTLRYAGLFEESLAAHHRAKALDPAQVTSVAWTYALRGDYALAVAEDRSALPFAGFFSELMRGDLGIEKIRTLEARAGSHGTRLAASAYRQILDRDVNAVRATLDALSLSGFADPEGWYLFAVSITAIDARALSLEYLGRAVKGGYGCHWPLKHLPVWDPYRGDPVFEQHVATTASVVERARRIFDEAGGGNVLGLRA